MGWGWLKAFIEALLPFLFRSKQAEKAQDAEPLDKDEAEWIAAQVRGTPGASRGVRDDGAESGPGTVGDLGRWEAGDGSEAGGRRGD